MGKVEDAGTETPETTCRSSADSQLLSVSNRPVLLAYIRVTLFEH